MPFEEFRDKVSEALMTTDHPMTWTELRTATGLPQKFPNNRWVHRLEDEIGLQRNRDKQGIIHWELSR